MKEYTFVKNKNIPVVIIIAIGLVVFLNIKKNQTYKQSHTQTAAHDKMARGIRDLTDEKTVVDYVKQFHQLPNYYLTKSQARKRGWNPAKGNLCIVLPGYAIGGDRFADREHRLPYISGRKWFEADINFDCGTRNADRLLFSGDGLVYITKDHYQTFQQQ